MQSDNEFYFGLDLLEQEGSSTNMGSAGSMATITSAEVKSPAGKTVGYDAQPDNFKGYKASGAKGKKSRLRKRV